jgi:hypothetical protein
MKREVSNLVSEEVKQAAELYATNKIGENYKYSIYWHDLYDAYIAGAKFNQPFEHEAKPEDNNGKQ